MEVSSIPHSSLLSFPVFFFTQKCAKSLTFYLLNAIIINAMWRLSTSTSRGGLSLRSIFVIAFTALAAAFLWNIVTPPAAYAADATWEGSTITYQGHPYTGPASDSTVQDLGLLPDTQVYTYVEPASNNSSGTTGTSSGSSPPRQIHIIYFGSDKNPSTATDAKYRTYEYHGQSSFTNPSEVKQISIDSQSTSASAGTTSCTVEGIGWIICPAMNFLASGMDWIYEILTGFLEVQAPQTGQDNALYRGWSYMRSFANVAFVIAFLIIIYSQITNIGINNYSIKRLLPRLIIAALLVNLSYFICIIAIDISNVLGYSVQNIFIAMRNGLVGAEGNNWDLISWQSMTTFILSGGTAAVAGLTALGITLSTYGIVGSLFLLLPALVIGLLAVLIALLIMAARQAIIIIMVILSPLAFVAFLLPNTEKWFDKWRSVMFTMLLLFPAFSVVFGGSQLAATAIIQSAAGAGSINLVILGLMVQVAPLFITPLLIRFGGNTLSRIAGMLNNPQKGLVDRTRNFAKGRADDIKARRLAEPATRRQFLRRNAQRMDYNRRRREGWKNAHNTMADSRWAGTEAASDINYATQQATDTKTLGETTAQARYSRAKVQDATIRELDTNLRTAKLQAEEAELTANVQWEGNHDPRVAQGHLNVRALNDRLARMKGVEDAEYEIYKTREFKSTAAYSAMSPAMRALVDSASGSAEDIAINAMASQSAQRVQQVELQKALAASKSLRDIAGVTPIDPHGAIRVEATAYATMNKADQEAVTNTIALFNQRAIAHTPNPMTVQQYTESRVKKQLRSPGSVDAIEFEAALEQQVQEGNILLAEQVNMDPSIDQSIVARVFARNVPKLKEAGGFHLQKDPSALVGQGEPALWKARSEMLAGTAADKLKNIKGSLFDDITVNIEKILAAAKPEDRETIFKTFRLASSDPGIFGGLTDRLENVRDIDRRITTELGKPPATKKPDAII